MSNCTLLEKMSFWQLVQCFVVFVVVVWECEGVMFFNNTSEDFVDNLHSFSDRSDKQRAPRFLNFHTEKDGNVEVELEFRVPFLNIPVKKAAETMAGWGQGVYGLPPKANVNIPALVLGGAVIFGAAVALPAITTLFTKKTTFFTGIGTMQGERIGHEKRSQRDDDLSRMMLVIEKILEENNIDTSTCLQRAMCRITKSATTKLKNGNPASYDLLITGLAKNSIFNNLIQDTYFHTAINSGLDNANCLVKYNACKVSQKTIHKLVNRISDLLNYSIL